MEFGLAAAAFGAAAVVTGGAAFAVVRMRRRRGADGVRPPAGPEAPSGIDPITGLMTRARFELALQDMLLQSEKRGEDCCVLHVLLDDVRLVVDDGGAELGEKVLGTVAARLRALVGTSTPVACLAGDEFALALIAPREAAEKLALRIVKAIPAPLNVDAREIELSASVGLAAAPEHGTGVRLLLRAAAASRAVQRSGGGAHAVFDPRIEAEHNSELTIARDLAEAVAKGQLELFFQPKIDARQLEVGAVEALLRWRHPAMGLVSPARFIPIAERHGLMDALGQWVVDGALKQAALWRGAGLRFQVAVNVSGVQFRRDDFTVRLARSLKAFGLPAAALVCEIAEPVALENTEATKRAFARLHKLGVRIAVGEFSGRPDALEALGGLPVHELKVARSLVAALPNDGDARLVVKAIVDAAHAGRLRVVAEGIENEAQRDQAVHVGCDDLQGYLFARPMSARAVAIWAVDASRNLAQTLRPSQFKDTLPKDEQPTTAAFAQTRISLRRGA